MAETSQSGHKVALFPLHFKVDQVPQLENRVPGTKKPVIGTNIVGGEYGGDRVFVLGFAKSDYKPFDLMTPIILINL
jgi:hypothetical protein